MAANGITISPRRVLDTNDEGEFESKTQAASEVPMHPLPEMIQTCWRSNLTAQKKVVDRHRHHGEKATAK